MKKIALIFVSLLLALLCSCSSFLDGGVEFYAGERLTPEAIQSMKDAFTSEENAKKPDKPKQTQAQTTSAQEPTEPVPDTTEALPDTSVPVQETTAAPDTTAPVPDTTESVPDTTEPVTDTTEAVTETTEPVPDTTEPSPDEITVYWTESGTKYHTHRDCGSLKNSVNVKEGTLEEAIEAGKESICLKCDKKDKAEKTEE